MIEQASNRRAFLKAGSAFAAPYFVPSHVLGKPGRTGANDRIEVAVIGVGVRGKYLIANLPESARVVALCDCSRRRIAAARKPAGRFKTPLGEFAKKDAKNCAISADYRKLLDKPKFDAVIIATPDHHHTLPALLALRAGLDVYLEKPLTLTIGEGRRLVDAVKKQKRILQVGSQQRTMEINRFACEFVRNGGIGKVSRVELPNYPGPMRYSSLPKEDIPADLNWEQFLGPTPLRPHNRRLWMKEDFKVGKLLWRGWDLFRAYSGHLMTNWGGHSVDMVQYSLGTDETGPVEIWPDTKELHAKLAVRWGLKTPQPKAGDDLMRFCPVSMRYANGVVLRFRPDAKTAVFHGSLGTMTISRNRYRANPAGLVKEPPDAKLKQKWSGLGHVARPHLANWLDCIRSRKTPNAPVETGHRTATICHLANIARELGRRLKWDPKRERFIGDTAADRLLNRRRRKGWQFPN